VKYAPSAPFVTITRPGLTAPSDDRGLSVFFNATYADRRASTQDNQLAAGLLYKGPFASRPADELGFAIGRTHVNSRVCGR
jgi:porin